MTIKLEMSISSAELGKLTDTLNRHTQKRADYWAKKAAEWMVDEVRVAIGDALIEDRAPHRRKKGATALINSFEGVVDDAGTPHVSARLTTKRGVSAAKVASLELGSSPHAIEGDPHLWFPDPRRDRSPAWYAFGPNNFRTPLVGHPGNRAYGFMEEARERTLQRVLEHGAAVSLL